MKYRKRILLLAVLALSAAFLFHHSVWAGKKISHVQKSITKTAGESRKLGSNGISKKNQNDVKWKDSSGSRNPKDDAAEVTPGTSYYRDFLVDNVLHTRRNGDIHYNVYVPDSYNGNDPPCVICNAAWISGALFSRSCAKYQNRRFWI